MSSQASGAQPRSGALVVLSAEAPNYLSVVDGFLQVHAGAKVLRVNAPDFAAELKAGLSSAKVALGVGPEAGTALVAERSPIPVLLAFNTLEPAPEGTALTVPVVVPPAAQVANIRKALPSVLDVPRQPRLGMLYDPALSSKLVAECEAAATAAGFSLVKVAVHQRSEVALAARDLFTRVQALWLIPDATVVSTESFRTLTYLSVGNRVPLVGFSEAMAKAGAVLAIQPNFVQVGRNAGLAAKRMADGAAPALEAAAALVFVNAKAATMLEIDLPKAAKASATKVYE